MTSSAVRRWRRAHAYQAQGRVSGLEISEDLTHIRAKVRGSMASKYRVDIRLDFGSDRLDAPRGRMQLSR